MRIRIIHSVGTYVLPEYRRRGIGERLRRMAMVISRELGFDKIQGVTYTEDATASIAKLGGKIVAAVMETPLKPIGE